MKKRTKQELLNEIEYLKMENIKISESLNAKKQSEWINNLDKARFELSLQLSDIFKDLVRDVKFEHVDESGYWFSFELLHDSRRQNHVVRHSEIR